MSTTLSSYRMLTPSDNDRPTHRWFIYVWMSKFKPKVQPLGVKCFPVKVTPAKIAHFQVITTMFNQRSCRNGKTVFLIQNRKIVIVRFKSVVLLHAGRIKKKSHFEELAWRYCAILTSNPSTLQENQFAWIFRNSTIANLQSQINEFWVSYEIHEQK